MRAAYVASLLCYLAFLGTPLAVADTIRETEPNDTQATANPTVGVNTLTVLGELSPVGDRDYFTFLVTDLGQPAPQFPSVVRITFSFATMIFSKPYSFQLTGPASDVIFSGQFSEPRIFLFNPSGIGGLGLYVIRIASESAASVGPYQLEVFGTCDGIGCRPPIVGGTAGTASTPPAPVPIQIPTLSPLGLLVLFSIVVVIGTLCIRRSRKTPVS